MLNLKELVTAKVGAKEKSYSLLLGMGVPFDEVEHVVDAVVENASSLSSAEKDRYAVFLDNIFRFLEAEFASDLQNPICRKFITLRDALWLSDNMDDIHRVVVIKQVLDTMYSFLAPIANALPKEFAPAPTNNELPAYRVTLQDALQYFSNSDKSTKKEIKTPDRLSKKIGELAENEQEWLAAKIHKMLMTGCTVMDFIYNE